MIGQISYDSSSSKTIETGKIGAFSSWNATAVTAATALAVFASMAFIYANPVNAILVTVGIVVMSLYTIPAALQHLNPTLVRIVIAISFIALGSLFLGGSLVFSYWTAHVLLLALKASFFQTALFMSIFSTASLGYGAPLGLSILNAGYEICLNQQWNHSLSALQHSYVPPRLLNIFSRISHLLLLIKPSAGIHSKDPAFLKFSLNFINPSKIKQAFKDTLESLIIEITHYRAHPDETFVSSNYTTTFSNLKHLLSIINDNDIDECVSLLLDNMDNLIPDAISKTQFVALFPEKTHPYIVLKATDFIDQASKIDTMQDDYDTLVLEKLPLLKKQVAAALQDKDDEQIKELAIEISNKKQLISAIRQSLSFITKEKTFWVAHVLDFQSILKKIDLSKDGLFLSALKNDSGINKLNKAIFDPSSKVTNTLERLLSKLLSIKPPPDSSYDSLLPILKSVENLETLKNYLNMSELNEDLFKHKLSEVDLNTQDDLTKHKIIPHENLSEDQIKALLVNLKTYIKNYNIDIKTFLDSHCPAFWKDSDIQNYFKTSSKEHLVEELASVGLKTKSDFVSYGLTLTDEQIIDIYTQSESKDLIGKAYLEILKPKLINHAETWFSNQDFKSKIYAAISHISQASGFLQELSVSVAKVVYRLAIIGMILVPILIVPKVAAAGFVVGLAYYTLRRFLRSPFQRFESIASTQRGNVAIIMGAFVSLISMRNFFSLTPGMRRNMDSFSQTDLFGKIRILNTELIITAGLCNVEFLVEFFFGTSYASPVLAAGAYGFMLANEVVDLV